jgi:hypothetical protein
LDKVTANVWELIEASLTARIIGDPQKRRTAQVED